MTGKTVGEAKEAALEQLGVAEADAEMIVVSEPKTGLFGRVRGEARVRARVRPVGPRPRRQRRSSRDRKSGSVRGGKAISAGDGGGGKNGSAGSTDSGASGGIREQAGDRQTSQRQSEGNERGREKSDEKEIAARQPGEGDERSRSSRRRRGRAGSKGSDAVARPKDLGNDEGMAQGDGERQGSRAGAPKRSRTKESTEMAEGMTLEEQAEVAKTFLAGLLDEYGFEASLETRFIDAETVEIAANGEGLGLLVGPKGSTLAALQDVTRTVVQRRCPSRTDRILVDVAGYRERRAAALRKFAEQIAGEVIESGTERALEPMSPADRKVVHDAINEIDGVVTRSEGEDLTRHVVIAAAG